MAVIHLVWTDFTLLGKVNMPLLTDSDPIRCFMPDFPVALEISIDEAMILQQGIQSRILSMKVKTPVCFSVRFGICPGFSKRRAPGTGVTRLFQFTGTSFTACTGLSQVRGRYRKDIAACLSTIMSKYYKQYMKEHFKPVFSDCLRN